MRPSLITLLFLVLAPTAAAQYTLAVVPDHAAWSVDEGVPRFAVRLGNCMGWTVQVRDGTAPVAGAAVSVTDGDGRRSLVYTGSDGNVQVGTRTCHGSEHVADHAFEVTGQFGGGAASSNRVVHEVMWSAAQVHADAPAQASGRITVPVAVVWTATGERAPVATVTVTYGSDSRSVALEEGETSLDLDVEGNATLTVSVPAPQWPKGGQDASIPVRPAGPHVIRASDATGSDSQTTTAATAQPVTSSSQSSTAPAGGGGGGGGQVSDPAPAPGIGPVPEPITPARQAQPKPATIGDTVEGAWTPHPVEDRNGAPGLPPFVVVAALALAMWRRRS